MEGVPARIELLVTPENLRGTQGNAVEFSFGLGAGTARRGLLKVLDYRHAVVATAKKCENEPHERDEQWKHLAVNFMLPARVVVHEAAMLFLELHGTDEAHPNATFAKTDYMSRTGKSPALRRDGGKKEDLSYWSCFIPTYSNRNTTLMVEVFALTDEDHYLELWERIGKHENPQIITRVAGRVTRFEKVA